MLVNVSVRFALSRAETLRYLLLLLYRHHTLSDILQNTNVRQGKGKGEKWFTRMNHKGESSKRKNEPASTFIRTKHAMFHTPHDKYRI